MAPLQQWQLRAEFARRLSDMYAKEVPAYGTLLAVSQEINREVMVDQGADAERLGTISRVSAERHGAIRLGTPREMAQAARLFAAMGMHPVGFYDLREAAGSAVPVVSTAFRPIDPGELALNPFRVFTSMLVPSDRRFFNADLQNRLTTFLDRRRLFPDELLLLADRGAAHGELSHADADRFVDLATAAFELSREPVDKAWYEELHTVSSVAADIGGVASTHINHLTPRVLDIDRLYDRMGQRGITMIDAIQGPPRWQGPDLLLRQTSFRALAEERAFRTPDGLTTTGDLRVRFGEVEARGIAATPAGRQRYDELSKRVEDAMADRPSGAPDPELRNSVAADIWRELLPGTETGLALDDLAYFTFRVREPGRRGAAVPPHDLRGLIEGDWVVAEPVVYEDFLPRSAAGIFQSNLTSDGTKDDDQQGTAIDSERMAGLLDARIHDPYELYEGMRRRSLTEVADALSIDAIRSGATSTTSDRPA
ncbi:DUF1338 family protein [Streptomyces sp. NPDC052077]|uniref:2-oxoadipate dioxygenase/decarboxylase n=1 Tax=Streptomyces sp. NPDC052077 TaxID=3154757 RepID=UPI003445AE92